MLNARKIRQEQGKSLEDVVRLSTISAGHLARFERGTAGLSTERLQELARVYGCTIDDLLREAEPAVTA